MKNIKYHLYIGEMKYCAKRMMEDTKGLGQRDVKGATNYCLIFDSCFFT